MSVRPSARTAEPGSSRYVPSVTKPASTPSNFFDIFLLSVVSIPSSIPSSNWNVKESVLEKRRALAYQQ
jgi:hypothetical protein